MERYSIQEKMKMVCRCKNSKIGLYVTAIVKDNETGNLHAQIKFKNISRKVVKDVTVSIQAWDEFGNVVKGIDSYVYENVNAKPGKYFADRIAVPFESDAVRHIMVHLLHVSYADGTEWINEEHLLFQKVKWYKRFLPQISVGGVGIIALVCAFILGMGTDTKGFTNIPFEMLSENLSAEQVVSKMGDNYATMSDGSTYFLNYGSYELNHQKGNLELFFDDSENLSKMVWDMGYATDEVFGTKEADALADYLNGELQCSYTKDDSDAKDITYDWSLDGISYELEYRKTSRGNGVTLTATSDGSSKL